MIVMITELTLVTVRVKLRGAYCRYCESGDRGAYCSYCVSGDRGAYCIYCDSGDKGCIV